MNLKTLILGACALALAAPAAWADDDHIQPPPGRVILDLDGRVMHQGFQPYATSFVAHTTMTHLVFAFRDDALALILDDVSLSTGGGGNLVVNGGFELSDGQPSPNFSQPDGWDYDFGSAEGALAFLLTGFGPNGSTAWYNNVVGGYDMLKQTVATEVGRRYDLSFLLESQDFPGQDFDTEPFRRHGESPVDLVVFANSGIPEPQTWSLMIAGFLGAGAGLRRRRAGPART